jgi:uncharacterized membrane protein YgcG
MNKTMTPEQALQILSDALQPNMADKITRAGYLAIEQAIQTLAAEIKQPEPSEDHATND